MSRETGTLIYCVGAQKSGTTWLSAYLRDHPEVYIPFHKEIDYFSSRQLGNARLQIRRRLDILMRDSIVPGTGSAVRPDFPAERIAELCHIIAVLGGKADYLSLFDGRPEGAHAFGDLSPSYSLLSQDGYADMFGRHPDTRFIFLMRDPVMRFWSSIRMWYTTNAETRAQKSIEDLFYERLRAKTCHLVQFSRYGRVIQALEAAVPRDRIHYEFYEHLFSVDGQARLDALTDFLGISRRPGALGRRVWETDTTQVAKSDLTQSMRNDAREVFDPVYRVIRDRFGDTAPASWLWETTGTPVREAALMRGNGGQ